MTFTAEDIEYHRPNGVPLLARLYRPRGEGPFPAVLEVHGGAWTGGDRFNNVAIAEHLAMNGTVVLSIDFRMPPVSSYPETVADVNYGIRWLKAHATRYGSRPDLVGALGTSSGGHLLLLNVLRPNDARYTALPMPDPATELVSQQTAALQFAIVCWPVADPLTRYRVMREAGNDRLVAAHHAFWADEAEMREGSPQHILESGEGVSTPPLLIMQGTADNNLTIDMAGRFASAYAQAGGTVVKEIFPGQPHAFIPSAPQSEASVRALSLINEFVHAHGPKARSRV